MRSWIMPSAPWLSGVWFAVMASTGLLSLGEPAVAQQSYSDGGAAACLECHESEKVMGILETPHANFDDPRSPASREQCESCHGPSATHMNFPMNVGNIVFTKHGKTPIAARNQTCLSCHLEGERAHWDDGAHGEKLACNDCHVMHQPRDPALSKVNQAQNCAECHAKILETAPAGAAHPLTGTGSIRCTECHNPHGPTTLAGCNTCHKQDPRHLAQESEKARSYHERALAKQIACTSCHKGFVHALPQVTRIETPPDF